MVLLSAFLSKSDVSSKLIPPLPFSLSPPPNLLSPPECAPCHTMQEDIGASIGVTSRMNDILRQSQELRERTRGILRGTPGTPPSSLATPQTHRTQSPVRGHPPPTLGSPTGMPSPYDRNVALLGDTRPIHSTYIEPLVPPPTGQVDALLSATAVPRVAELASFHRNTVERYENRILELEAEVHGSRDEVAVCTAAHTTLLGQIQELRSQILSGGIGAAQNTRKDDTIAELTTSLTERKKEVVSLKEELQNAENAAKSAQEAASSAHHLPLEAKQQTAKLLIDYERLADDISRVRTELRSALESQAALRSQLDEKDGTVRLLSAELEARQTKESGAIQSTSVLRNEITYLRAQNVEMTRLAAQKEAKSAEAERQHFERLLEKDRMVSHLQEETHSMQSRLDEQEEKLRDAREALLSRPRGTADTTIQTPQNTADSLELARLRNEAAMGERSKEEMLAFKDENTDLRKQIRELESKIEMISLDASANLQDWSERVVNRAEHQHQHHHQQHQQPHHDPPKRQQTPTTPTLSIAHTADPPLDPLSDTESRHTAPGLLVVPDYRELVAHLERLPHDAFTDKPLACSVSGVEYRTDIAAYISTQRHGDALRGALRSLLSAQENAARSVSNGLGHFMAPVLYAGAATYLLPVSTGDSGHVAREVMVLVTDKMLYLLTVGAAVLRCFRLDCLACVVTAKVSKKSRPSSYKVGLKAGTPSGAWGLPHSDHTGPDLLLMDVEKVLVDILRTVSDTHGKIRKSTLPEQSSQGFGGLFAKSKKDKTHHEVKDDRAIEKDLILAGVVSEAVHGNLPVECFALSTEVPTQAEYEPSLDSFPEGAGGGGGGGGGDNAPAVPAFDPPASPLGEMGGGALSAFSQDSFSPKHRQATPDVYRLDQEALGGVPKKNSAPPPIHVQQPTARGEAGGGGGGGGGSATKSPAATVFLLRPGREPYHCSVNYPVKFTPDAFLKGMAAHVSERLGEEVTHTQYALHLAPVEVCVVFFSKK